MGNVCVMLHAYIYIYILLLTSFASSVYDQPDTPVIISAIMCGL